MENSSGAHRAAGGISAVYPQAPANDAGRDFHVLITWAGGAHGFTDKFEHACDAAVRGREYLGERCGKVEVRPAIESSFLEGRARFPEALHPEATDAARDGWVSAAGGAEVPTKTIVIAPADRPLSSFEPPNYEWLLDKQQRDFGL